MSMTAVMGWCSVDRKLKVTVVKREELRPICKHELVELYYFGDKMVDGCGFEDYEENSRVVWFIKEKRKWGSGSYEEE